MINELFILTGLIVIGTIIYIKIFKEDTKMNKINKQVKAINQQSKSVASSGRSRPVNRTNTRDRNNRRFGDNNDASVEFNDTETFAVSLMSMSHVATDDSPSYTSSNDTPSCGCDSCGE